MVRSVYTVENVEAVLDKKVTKDGKIGGLSEWRNRRAIVIITRDDEETETKNECGQFP